MEYPLTHCISHAQKPLSLLKQPSCSSTSLPKTKIICSRCNLEKEPPSIDIGKKDDICDTCVLLAVKIASQNNQGLLKWELCLVCNIKKTRKHFPKVAWRMRKKFKGMSCKACLGERYQAQKKTCFLCDIEKPHDDFDRGEWRKEKSRCLDCIKVQMKIFLSCKIEKPQKALNLTDNSVVSDIDNVNKVSPNPKRPREDVDVEIGLKKQKTNQNEKQMSLKEKDKKQIVKISYKEFCQKYLTKDATANAISEYMALIQLYQGKTYSKKTMLSDESYETSVRNGQNFWRSTCHCPISNQSVESEVLMDACSNEWSKMYGQHGVDFHFYNEKVYFRTKKMAQRAAMIHAYNSVVVTDNKHLLKEMTHEVNSNPQEASSDNLDTSKEEVKEEGAGNKSIQNDAFCTVSIQDDIRLLFNQGVRNDSIQSIEFHDVEPKKKDEYNENWNKTDELNQMRLQQEKDAKKNEDMRENLRRLEQEKNENAKKNKDMRENLRRLEEERNDYKMKTEEQSKSIQQLEEGNVLLKRKLEQLTGLQDLSDGLKAELECPVCLDPLDNPYMNPECGHRFCYRCITQSISKCGKECPLCRVKITSKRGLRKDKLIGSITDVVFQDDECIEIN